MVNKWDRVRLCFNWLLLFSASELPAANPPFTRSKSVLYFFFFKFKFQHAVVHIWAFRSIKSPPNLSSFFCFFVCFFYSLLANSTHRSTSRRIRPLRLRSGPRRIPASPLTTNISHSPQTVCPHTARKCLISMLFPATSLSSSGHLPTRGRTLSPGVNGGWRGRASTVCSVCCSPFLENK